MAARLYEDDQNRGRDQHPCALRDLCFWHLLRDRILRSAGPILGPGRDGPSSRLDVVHDATTCRARDARSECVPDARGDQDHEARLQVGARPPQGGRGHDGRGPRDGGARGRGRVRGGAARDAREHRARVRAPRCVGCWLVRVGYHEA